MSTPHTVLDDLTTSQEGLEACTYLRRLLRRSRGTMTSKIPGYPPSVGTVGSLAITSLFSKGPEVIGKGGEYCVADPSNIPIMRTRCGLQRRFFSPSGLLPVFFG